MEKHRKYTGRHYPASLREPWASVLPIAFGRHRTPPPQDWVSISFQAIGDYFVLPGRENNNFYANGFGPVPAADATTVATTAAVLGRLCKGLASCGGWVVFEKAHLLGSHALTVLSQHLRAISEACPPSRLLGRPIVLLNGCCLFVCLRTALGPSSSMACACSPDVLTRRPSAIHSPAVGLKFLPPPPRPPCCLFSVVMHAWAEEGCFVVRGGASSGRRPTRTSE